MDYMRHLPSVQWLVALFASMEMLVLAFVLDTYGNIPVDEKLKTIKRTISMIQST